MEINQQQLDEILADFSASGRATFLDDPILGLGYGAIDRAELGIPPLSQDLPRFPVAVVQRHQELWAHPGNETTRQEVWTEHALSLGMQRLGLEVRRLPSLGGWLIAEWPLQGGGLQLQQPDGQLFVYALCHLPPGWLDAARGYGSVLVLHGPQLGLRATADPADAEQLPAAELESAHKEGMVTGGLIRWGSVPYR
jgi:hypothetical protein